MRTFTIAILLGTFLGGFVVAEPVSRWVPEYCLAHSPEASWNGAYRAALHAIELADYDVAESEMCRALLAARGFDPRDWRFAETLDELGLIAFQLRDYDAAERVQGAAIAEMLLAVGPQGEPLKDIDHPIIRPDCASGVRVYTKRLGWIQDRVPGRAPVDELRIKPWRVFAAGYLPLDADLAHRLDWLVSQYLLQEDVAASDALAELQGKIRGETEPR